MFLGGFALALLYVALFDSLGLFSPALAWPFTAVVIAAIALAAVLVESLPFPDLDNLTITAACLVLGWLWLSPA
jgi:hypothetical protein